MTNNVTMQRGPHKEAHSAFGAKSLGSLRVPFVTSIPRMRFFTGLRSNIAGEDNDELAYIPYFSDEETELLDDEYTRRLFKVPGVDRGSQFFHVEDLVLQSVVEKFGNSTEIFDILADYFDKEPEKVIERWKVLAERSAPPIVAHSESTNPTNEAQLMSSFRSLWCMRCQNYCCDDHGPNQVLPHGQTPFNLRPFDPRPQPCRRCGGADSVDEDVSQSIGDMSEFELQQCHKLFKCKLSPCDVAAALGNRTCAEMKLFLKQHPVVQEQPMEKPKRRKKTSSNLRTISTMVKQHERHGKITPIDWAPCSCVGECTSKTCSCMQHGTPCEKYCGCPPSCSVRFPGCSCALECDSQRCPCFSMHRECDPDLCRSCAQSHGLTMDHSTAACNAGLTSSVRPTAMQSAHGPCRNMNLTLGIAKHVLLGPSDVHGWGAFLKDGANANEFIAEYVGEVLSQDEAERRGHIYDKRKMSFLFQLEKSTVVDATRKGNKMRFANHSSQPNMEPRVMRIKGDHRIGFYALRRIRPGEEITFDYGDNHEFVLKTPTKSKAKASRKRPGADSDDDADSCEVTKRPATKRSANESRS
eukprot:TRINITY_DN2989_c0_g6_i2.p1 TRINITY_DN2989_c0_g6~~TRINITY_DN2989_c0_g6_i2.p1  ORF type:complete len:583 (+),score=37.48 TRINITY_DN2989_c0_g6_i2:310-2058(+)